MVQQPSADPVKAAVRESVAPASAKPMRTLEEVRADLARLREKSRERQAQAPVRADIGFAPTDFMDFGNLKLRSAH